MAGFWLKGRVEGWGFRVLVLGLGGGLELKILGVGVQPRVRARMVERPLPASLGFLSARGQRRNLIFHIEGLP